MDEQQLVSRAQEGDQEAFTKLVNAYHRSVIAWVSLYIGRQDASDIGQEIWMKVYQKLWQVEEEMRFSGWLRTLVFHHCLNRRKRRSVRFSREVFLDPEEWANLVEFVAHGDQLEDVVENRMLRAEVSNWLDQLPGDYGLILRLRYMRMMSYEKIAELIQRPLSTVKWRIHQGKRILRTHVIQDISESRSVEWK